MAQKVDKAALLAALRPKLIPYPVEGFGEIFIRQLSVTEVESIRAALKPKGKKPDKKDATAVEGPDQFALRLVLMSVVDGDGGRVFEDTDLPQLQDSSNFVMDGLVGRTLELNGFKRADDEKKD